MAYEEQERERKSAHEKKEEAEFTRILGVPLKAHLKRTSDGDGS